MLKSKSLSHKQLFGTEKKRIPHICVKELLSCHLIQTYHNMKSGNPMSNLFGPICFHVQLFGSHGLPCPTCLIPYFLHPNVWSHIFHVYVLVPHVSMSNLLVSYFPMPNLLVPCFHVQLVGPICCHVQFVGPIFVRVRFVWSHKCTCSILLVPCFPMSSLLVPYLQLVGPLCSQVQLFWNPNCANKTVSPKCWHVYLPKANLIMLPFCGPKGMQRCANKTTLYVN